MGSAGPYVRNSRHEARRARRLLTAAIGIPVMVDGIVVPVGAGHLTIKQPPVDVHVVNRMAIARWLGERPEHLDLSAVKAIYEVARRSTTWRTGA